MTKQVNGYKNMWTYISMNEWLHDWLATEIPPDQTQSELDDNPDPLIPTKNT